LFSRLCGEQWLSTELRGLLELGQTRSVVYSVLVSIFL